MVRIFHGDRENLENQYITKISLKGYKSFSEEKAIEIRNLTILAGSNSSGKSSIFQPLLLMKQTLEESFDPGALLINGSHVKFTKIDQMLSKLHNNRSSNFSVTLWVHNTNYFKFVFEKNPSKGIDVAENIISSDNKITTLNINMTSDELKKQESEQIKSIVGFLYQSQKNKGLPKREDIEKNLALSIQRDRCYLEVIAKYESSDSHLNFPSGIFSSGSDMKYSINKNLLNIIHVPALRGNPRRLYQKTGVETRFPGTFENYIASIITYWMKSDVSKLDELSASLVALGLSKKVKTKEIDDANVEILVPQLPILSKGSDKNWISIADVGFGVSQTLPILVALLVAEKGQMVYIEQPEIHLHPEVQLKLAELFVKAANRGVRLIIETHSDILLLGIQTLLAEENISPNDVIFHWFERDKNGATQITSSTLNKDGSYVNWPQDFGRIYLSAQQRFVTASKKQIFKNN